MCNLQKINRSISTRIAISDGAICEDCIRTAGIPFHSPRLKPDIVKWMKSYNRDSVKIMYEKRLPLVREFHPNKKIGLYLKIDEVHQSFKVDKYIFAYQNLLNFEFIDDGEVLTSGGLAGVIAGGLLFGATGAIVGGIVGEKQSTKLCNCLKIQLTLKDSPIPIANITFIKRETERKGYTYNTAQKMARECVAALQFIADKNNQAAQVQSISSGIFSPDDEIVKLKKLLDDGIITKVEFEQKKTQLLRMWK